MIEIKEIEKIDKINFKYRISRMRVEDINEIMEIEEISFPRPWRRRQFKEELSIPVSNFYVMRGRWKDEQIKEVLLAYGGFWKVRDEAHIVNFAVHPKYRRQGIGSIFLDELIGKMKTIGCKACYLEVRASNIIAQKLYEKFGFKKIDVRKNYYGYPQEDAYVYRKEF